MPRATDVSEGTFVNSKKCFVPEFISISLIHLVYSLQHKVHPVIILPAR